LRKQPVGDRVLGQVDGVGMVPLRVGVLAPAVTNDDHDRALHDTGHDVPFDSAGVILRVGPRVTSNRCAIALRATRNRAALAVGVRGKESRIRRKTLTRFFRVTKFARKKGGDKRHGYEEGR
jgi:hypothetical protein